MIRYRYLESEFGSVKIAAVLRFRIWICMDPDPGGQRWTTKIEKSEEKCKMFSFEGLL